MLKIWGRTNSVNVQKAIWCIAELGLKHERIDAGLQFGVNKEDWYLAMNPNGLVPVIDDDGFILWESNSIVRYLAAKHGSGSLSPDALTIRALAESWMDWQLTVLMQPMTTVFWNLIRTAPEQRDIEAVAAGVKQSNKVYAMLDQHLADRDYVCGDTFTMGDIPVGAMTYRWYAMSIEHQNLPNLYAWYQRLCERPAYQQHVMLPLS